MDIHASEFEYFLCAKLNTALELWNTTLPARCLWVVSDIYPRDPHFFRGVAVEVCWDSCQRERGGGERERVASEKSVGNGFSSNFDFLHK